jgi:hypothetical protein
MYAERVNMYQACWQLEQRDSHDISIKNNNKYAFDFSE